ncbi:MAG: hypothetical protein NTW28_08470 [Candidatus Solibacter sp.]|nr:hypothetical protein [Candidatus Solibacter sp.]
MKNIKWYKVGGILTAALLCATVLNADTFSVGNVGSWNVGSGQVNGKFQVQTIDDFAGLGALELGLRAQQRRIGPIDPVGDDYFVNAGPDIGASNPNMAWWNFDWSALGAAAAGIDHLWLTISTPDASSGPFDLITDRQDSSNMGYAGWFPSFDMNKATTYHFELTAEEDVVGIGAVVSNATEMDVVVTPEPSEMAMVTVLFGAVLVFVRRRKLAA